MRKLFTLLFSFSIIFSTQSQTTSSPYVQSKNTDFIKLKEVRLTTYSTEIDYSLYTSKTGQSFFIHPQMYIESSYGSSVRYMIREFKSNKLNHTYTPEPYTTYNITLVFEPIPKGIYTINIKEPSTEGYNAWQWLGVSINNKKASSYSSSSSYVSSYTEDDYNSSTALGEFFKTNGVSLLAFFAHPTNTYDGGSYTVYNDNIIVNIEYENYNTKLRINISNGFFSSIDVLADDDWAYPFLGMTLIKIAADEYLLGTAENDELKSKMEKYFRKKYDEFDGQDLALFALNVAFLSD